MGKSYTPTFRAEYRDQTGVWNTISWDGKASDTRAELKRRGLNESFKPGQVNAHVSEALGFIPHIVELRVIRQRTGRVEASAKAPMFEVA
jgi:hypothetical protein